MMFNALTAVKFVVSGVVGIGTGKIVSGIVKDHVKPETLIDKVSIAAATWTLSGVVTTASKKYTGEMIDDVYSGVTETLAKIKLAQKLTRINNGQSTFEAEGLNEKSYERGADGKYTYVGEKSDGMDEIVTETPAAG